METNNVDFVSKETPEPTCDTVIVASLEYEGEKLRVEFQLDWVPSIHSNLYRLSVFIVCAEPEAEVCIFNHQLCKTPVSLPHWRGSTGKNLERILIIIRDAAAGWESLTPEQQEAAHTCEQIFECGYWMVLVLAEWQVQLGWRLLPIAIRRVVMGTGQGTFQQYCKSVLRAK
ncbi:MAG TPA: hypothetical protein VNG90_01020 [Candidatus Acidoferrum sp.]|nr:hypothetical protein [Candidatus Acidoferrum sp.]